MENKELLHLMEKCGHFLYHRRGGKRGQVKILKILNENGHITQKELMETLTLKSGSLSESVKKLENQGFISKEKDEMDKRKINITITNKGREFLENQLYITSSQEEILFNALTSEEQENLKLLLAKLFLDWESKFDNSLFNHRK